MTNEALNVTEEIQNKEVVPPVEENVSQDAQPASQENALNDKEHNFKQLREVNKQLEQKLKDYETRLEGIEASSKNENSPLQNSNEAKPSEDFEIGEEDLVEGKHLKKALSKIENLLYQKELEAIPDRLRGKFKNFDQVVTKENLEKLKRNEPELYRTIKSGDDLFSKGVSAYKTLVSLGYGGENYMKQKEQVAQNHNKPLSAQAIKGHGALHEANAFANGLTPELKKQLQQEMVEAAKSR